MHRRLVDLLVSRIGATAFGGVNAIPAPWDSVVVAPEVAPEPQTGR